LPVLWKTKPADTLMADVLVEVASLCDARLGEACAAFRQDLGLAGCHERELALYELPAPRLRRHMPACLGTHRNPAGGTWSVAMEYLPDAAAVDAATTVFSPSQLAAVLGALADVHANWYQREAELRALPWLVPPPTTARMREMTPLWQALAAHSEAFFTPWLAAPLLPLQEQLIASIDEWWPALRSLPQALVHNDFNPRNLVLRRTDRGPVPAILDWELATVGVPQHDLAELLCFVLPPQCDVPTLASILEQHRRTLQAATGVAIDHDEWRRGFELSLRYLMLYRLPLYTLMHRFSPQAFLPRVIRNWAVLYRLSAELGRRPAPHAGEQAEHDHQHGHGEQVLRPDAERPANIESDDVRHVRNIH
jgi:hypothetical protein